MPSSTLMDAIVITAATLQTSSLLALTGKVPSAYHKQQPTYADVDAVRRRTSRTRIARSCCSFSINLPVLIVVS
jgi:hypothetical protein